MTDPTGKVESVAEEAQRIVTGSRRETYGPVMESFERIAKKWSVTLGTPVTAKQVSLCMIDLKTCRELGKAHRDNWVDICGYAILGEQLSNA